MSKCNFSIEFNQAADNLIANAESAISKAGGEFNGTNGNGNFQLQTPLGKINGSYIIQDKVINIQIDSKPLIISCTRIQEELKKYLSA